MDGTLLIQKYFVSLLDTHLMVHHELLLTHQPLPTFVLCLLYMCVGAVAIHNQALRSSVYSGLALLRYVSCNGTETNFTDCDYDVLYSGYCNYNFAAVYCQEGIFEMLSKSTVFYIVYSNSFFSTVTSFCS